MIDLLNFALIKNDQVFFFTFFLIFPLYTLFPTLYRHKTSFQALSRLPRHINGLKTSTQLYHKITSILVTSEPNWPYISSEATITSSGAQKNLYYGSPRTIYPLLGLIWTFSSHDYQGYHLKSLMRQLVFLRSLMIVDLSFLCDGRQLVQWLGVCGRNIQISNNLGVSNKSFCKPKKSETNQKQN